MWYDSPHLHVLIWTQLLLCFNKIFKPKTSSIFLYVNDVFFKYNPNTCGSNHANSPINEKNNNINPISLLKKGVVEKHVIILRAPIS